MSGRRQPDSVPSGKKRGGADRRKTDMRLSKRMHMVADLVKQGETLADIGCDHGYLSVWLVREGTVNRAIATDIGTGPLMRAEESIRFFHQQERIVTRLSDGMDALIPGEADRIVIAGMGGILMSDILARGEAFVRSAGQLVLQPQSDPQLVRKTVHALGFRITDEKTCFEDGKYYLAFSCEPGAEETAYTETEYRYGRIAVSQKQPAWISFLTEELLKKERMLNGLIAAGTESAREKVPTVSADVAELKRLLPEERE